MTKPYLFVLALLIATISYSQNGEDSYYYTKDEKKTKKKSFNYTKHRFGLNIGGTNPLGEFSEINPYNEGSGYAEGGISIGFSYQYSFDRNFALTFMYGSSVIRFNAQAFANQLAIENPNYNWRVEADPYNVGFAMLGAKAYYGTTVKAYINPMLGLGSMISPALIISASNNSNYINQTIQASDPSIAGIFALSIGIDFNVSKLISINIDGTYMSSEFKITQESLAPSTNATPSFILYEYNQPFSALNFSLGIGFHF